MQNTTVVEGEIPLRKKWKMKVQGQGKNNKKGKKKGGNDIKTLDIKNCVCSEKFQPVFASLSQPVTKFCGMTFFC